MASTRDREYEEEIPATHLVTLCHKFAQLTKQIHVETQARQNAETQVRHLKRILKNDDQIPTITSCKSDIRAYVNKLKKKLHQAHDQLEKLQNLRLESDGARSPENRGHEGNPQALAKLERQWTAKIQHQQKENETQRQEIQKLNNILQRERAEKEKLKTAHKQSQLAGDDKTKKIEKLKHDLHTITESEQHFSIKCKDLQQKVEICKEQEMELAQQIQTLVQMNETLEKRNRALLRGNQLNQTLTQQLQIHQDKLQIAEQRNRDMCSQVTQLQAQFTQQEEKLRQEYEDEKRQMQHTLQEHQQEIQRLKIRDVSKTSDLNGIPHPSGDKKVVEHRRPNTLSLHEDRVIVADKLAIEETAEIDDHRTRLGPDEPNSLRAVQPLDDSTDAFCALRKLRQQNVVLRERLQKETNATHLLEQDLIQTTANYNNLFQGDRIQFE